MDYNNFYGLMKNWENTFEVFQIDESLNISDQTINKQFNILENKLKNNYPYFHPCYAGQMLKPPHPIAVAAYLSTMRINPNNHALDGGPATSELEKEIINKLAKMFGFEKNLGHLTSGGTFANLEALWISGKLHPDKYIAYSQQAHYTHNRMCDVLKLKSVSIKSDKKGKMDLKDLENKLKDFEIGTVVVTAGTTSLGAIDPINEIINLSKKYNFRVHVDSAYGGFYKLLSNTEIINKKDFEAISKADSVVIDPHKHGLQPYGCGCIIFSDPNVGKLYSHDSPYTYFTSNDLHLGEISLECSRAGASAAALWTTLEAIPLEENNGFGKILTKTRKAALEFSKLLKNSERYFLYLEPELDIVCYFPKTKNNKSSEISKYTEKIFDYLEKHPTEPLFLAKLKVNKEQVDNKFNIIWDSENMTILRSCLMKPEHLNYINTIFDRLEKSHKFLFENKVN